ncbi:molybdate ABC transporter substrate-binding protein [Desulfosarcina sp. OttesenSCG-928-G10]|nr:molybdate ABC transporter substrate-binding protein [Desulfosarcina sp. OttesenSCG-928-G10]MDL2321867.1 molybdate ABC transporter substrate-binding protein [Desulfosarcina sp. OttesenSCG-928-B08]
MKSYVKHAVKLMVSVLTVAFFFSAGSAAAAEVTIFAAASTTTAITEIGDLYAAKNLGTVKSSFASSSTLAKQIESGAPADVFLSANIEWMDFLADKKAIDPSTRQDLLGNRLVLIAPADSSVKTVEIKPGFDLVGLLGKDGRLATGNPEHVPAGMYGKTALSALGTWNSVKDRIAPMKDVRAALVLVERAEAPLGIVYATDAAISDKVRVVGTFPENTHPPIVYPVAAVAGKNTEAANAFITFLASPEAKAIFARYGFHVIE